MKKFVFLLIVVILIMLEAAYAEESTEVYTCGDFEYILLEDGTAEITKYNISYGEGTELVIPAELDGIKVTRIGERSFGGSFLTKITILDGVTTIGESAFGLCTSLTAITIPDSLLSIGEYAFLRCYALTDITIPNGVTSIGDGAFSECDSLTTIAIPDSVTNIGSGVFMDCDALAEIMIPDSAVTVDELLLGCHALQEIHVSSEHPTLAAVGGVLFDKSKKTLICCPGAYTSYEIPEGIVDIASRAFSNCTSLTKLSIPDSVVTVQGKQFAGCTALESFYVSPEHPTLATIDGVLYSKSDKMLVCCPKRFTSYEIPYGILSIGKSAFAECEDLVELIIPDSVTDIGESAFSRCDSLQVLTIPNSVSSIGDGAFFWCMSLTELMIPDSVISIGDDAFFWCDNLTLTVEKDSVAAAYAKENGIPYIYPDSLDWLNS